MQLRREWLVYSKLKWEFMVEQRFEPGKFKFQFTAQSHSHCTISALLLLDQKAKMGSFMWSWILALQGHTGIQRCTKLKETCQRRSLPRRKTQSSCSLQPIRKWFGYISNCKKELQSWVIIIYGTLENLRRGSLFLQNSLDKYNICKAMYILGTFPNLLTCSK